MVLSTEIWKSKHGIPSSAKLRWNKPTAMHLAYIHERRKNYFYQKKRLNTKIKKVIKINNNKNKYTPKEKKFTFRNNVLFLEKN